MPIIKAMIHLYSNSHRSRWTRVSRSASVFLLLLLWKKSFQN